MKTSDLAVTLFITALLFGCGMDSMHSTATPYPAQNLTPTPTLPGTLSASFVQPVYRLGDTVEFYVLLVNEEAEPRTVTLSMTLTGDYDSGLIIADKESFEPVWSEHWEERLEPGEERTITYEIPYSVYDDMIGAAYDAVGTGQYQLHVDAMGQSVVAETRVIGVFAVEVTYPSPLQAGQTVTVQAVVKNMSGFDVHDVRASGSMVGFTEHSLGIVPAHDSKTVTWTLTVPDSSVFAPTIFIESADGGNNTVSAPSASVTPIANP